MAEMADADYEETLDSDKTPVTIVTGFLGSGKTTLGKFEEFGTHPPFFDGVMWLVCVSWVAKSNLIVFMLF